MQFSNFTAEKKNMCRFCITWALRSDMIKVYEVINAVAHLDGPFIIILRLHISLGATPLKIYHSAVPHENSAFENFA